MRDRVTIPRVDEQHALRQLDDADEVHGFEHADEEQRWGGDATIPPATAGDSRAAPLVYVRWPQTVLSFIAIVAEVTAGAAGTLRVVLDLGAGLGGMRFALDVALPAPTGVATLTVLQLPLSSCKVSVQTLTGTGAVRAFASIAAVFREPA